MVAPLIAVAGFRVPPEGIEGWAVAAYAVPETYVEAVRRAGGVPAALAPGRRLDEVTLERFEGLLLVGGGDVEPARYGGAGHDRCYGLDPERDEFEIALLRAADRAGVPTLAICRGAQVLNVAFGGTLVPHLPDVPGMLVHGTGTPTSAWHEVKVRSDTRLFEACGRSVVTVASRHHQGIERLGEGLVPVGWSDDGLVEAVERERGWMLGVQWHPETTAGKDPGNQALFDALVDRARSRSALVQ